MGRHNFSVSDELEEACAARCCVEDTETPESSASAISIPKRLCKFIYGSDESADL